MVVEKAMRSSKVNGNNTKNENNTINRKFVQLLVCADDIQIVAQFVQHIKKSYVILQTEAPDLVRIQ